MDDSEIGVVLMVSSLVQLIFQVCGCVGVRGSKNIILSTMLINELCYFHKLKIFAKSPANVFQNRF